jgi:hypothetical protein
LNRKPAKNREKEKIINLFIYGSTNSSHLGIGKIMCNCLLGQKIYQIMVHPFRFKEMNELNIFSGFRFKGRFSIAHMREAKPYMCI